MVVGFLLYGLFGYSIYSKIHTDRDRAYDLFVLSFENGTVIAEAFTNDSSVCGWAIGVLNYKGVPRSERKHVILKPTKMTDDPGYTQWCQIR